MDRIRVYEAAKKLNLESKNLIKTLQEKGVDVKSPISFITKAQFDDLLNTMTSSEDKPPTGDGKVLDLPRKPAEKEKAEPAQQAAGAGEAEKETSKLSLVKPEPEPKEAKKPAKKKARTRKAKKAASAKKAAAAKKAEAAKPAKAPAKSARRPKTGGARKQPVTSAVSYLALGIAAMALLAALVINSSVSKNAAGVQQAVTATQGIDAEMAAINDGLRINQDLIFENRDALAQLKLSQAQGDLAEQSAALDELAATLPADLAARVTGLSRGLETLASSL